MFTFTDIDQLDFIDTTEDNNDVPEHLRPNDEMRQNFIQNCKELGMWS